MAEFFNQAAFTYNGNTVNSNTTTGDLVDTVTVSKTAAVDSYSQNGNVTYIVTITNTGTTPYTDLTITDNLGEYDFAGTQAVPLTYTANSAKLFINGILQPTVTVDETSPLTITGINVPAGGNAVLVYETTANTFASPEQNGTINNTVTLTGDNISQAITAEETVTAVTEPIISIVKNLSPTTVNINGEVTYTFTIYNRGNEEVTAAANAFIEDTFTPALSNITVDLDGAPLALTTDYTYTEATGAFRTNNGVITVPAATFEQDPSTGAYTTVPGTAVLTVTGTIG